jgi:ParB family chromosome partitioning protein
LAKERGRSAGKSAKKRAVKSPDTLAVERRVSNALGLAVTIGHRGKGGVLQVRYRTLEQLDEVVRRLEQG